MDVRSVASPRGKWLLHVLALPVLGAMVLSAVLYAFAPSIQVDDGFEWVNHRVFRGGVALFLFGAACWISAHLSTAVSRAELVGEKLLTWGLLGRRRATESLGDLKAVHPHGVVEFVGGRKVHLGDHPTILQQILERQVRSR